MEMSLSNYFFLIKIKSFFYLEEFLQFSFSKNHCEEINLWHFKFAFHSSLYNMNTAFFSSSKTTFCRSFLSNHCLLALSYSHRTYPLIQITHFFLSSPLHFFHILQLFHSWQQHRLEQFVLLARKKESHILCQGCSESFCLENHHDQKARSNTTFVDQRNWSIETEFSSQNQTNNRSM